MLVVTSSPSTITAGRRPAPLAPVVAVLVGRVVGVGVVPLPRVDHVRGPRADLPVLRVGLVEELDEVVPDGDDLLRVVEELGDPQVDLVEVGESIVALMPPGTTVCGCGYLPPISTYASRATRVICSASG